MQRSKVTANTTNQKLPKLADRVPFDVRLERRILDRCRAFCSDAHPGDLFVLNSLLCSWKSNHGESSTNPILPRLARLMVGSASTEASPQIESTAPKTIVAAAA